MNVFNTSALTDVLPLEINPLMEMIPLQGERVLILEDTRYRSVDTAPKPHLYTDMVMIYAVCFKRIDLERRGRIMNNTVFVCQLSIVPTKQYRNI